MLAPPPTAQKEPQNLSTSQCPAASQAMVMIPHHIGTQWHVLPQPPPVHMMYAQQPTAVVPVSQPDASGQRPQDATNAQPNQQQPPPQQQQQEQQQSHPHLTHMTPESLQQLSAPPLVHSIWSNSEMDGHFTLTELQRHDSTSQVTQTDSAEEEQETKPKIKKEVKKKRKLADLLAEGIDPTKLEENSDQVRERFNKGCECEGDNCFKNMNPEFVFRHRLNIAELTKNEHDMYLMGVTMACLANPEETSRHKERKRLRASYVFQGKKVCLDAFLYLENCTHYQLKAIRKHVMVNGVTPRVHGNHGKKPPNTFPLDTYQHAAAFLQSYIARYSPNNANTPKKQNKSGKAPPVYLPAEITRKKIHNAYKEYCEHFEPDVKVMGYSSFRHFMKEQFPNVKFFRMEKKPDRIGGQSDDETENEQSSNQTGATLQQQAGQDPRTDQVVEQHGQQQQPQPQQQQLQPAQQQAPPQPVPQDRPKDARNTPPVTTAPPVSVPPNSHPGVPVSMAHPAISTSYQPYQHVQLPLNLQTQQPLYSACMQPGMFPPGQPHPPQVRPNGFPYTNL